VPKIDLNNSCWVGWVGKGEGRKVHEIYGVHVEGIESYKVVAQQRCVAKVNSKSVIDPL
jgi:hypothetical protein